MKLANLIRHLFPPLNRIDFTCDECSLTVTIVETPDKAAELLLAVLEAHRHGPRD